MLMLVAGPYSAPTEEDRAANLARMNMAAAAIAARGLIPVIGVNVALPVLRAAGLDYSHPWMMAISLAVTERCDAGLQIGHSPGADREIARLIELGRPAYRSLEEVPAAPPAA
jgi:hypothetical protein